MTITGFWDAEIMDTDHLLTLAAGEAATAAESSIVAPVIDALKAAGAAVGTVVRFDDGAWDLPFAGITPLAAADTADGALAGQAVDVAAQEQRNPRRKGLLVADMDSTIVTSETLDELAAVAGLGERVAAITARAMAGELDFDGALRERVAMLKGLTADTLGTVTEQITLSPGAKTLVGTMKAHGATTLLVSGGFETFVTKAAAMAGFDACQGNRLELADGKLTGGVLAPILGRDAKLAALTAATEKLELSPADACAVGDGANDLAMVDAAGLGVAYHAKPVVAAAATARVRHGDLTTLLLFQGYPRSAFQA